jgi:hypothetical protein
VMLIRSVSMLAASTDANVQTLTATIVSESEQAIVSVPKSNPARLTNLMTRILPALWQKHQPLVAYFAARPARRCSM